MTAPDRPTHRWEVSPFDGRESRARTSGRPALGARTIALALGIALLVVAGPWLAPYDPLAIVPDPAAHSLAPSVRHWLGTDPLGRDIVSRLLAGARLSLGISVASLSIAVVSGVLVGAIAFAVGSWGERLLMRVVDLLLAIPRLVLLIAAVGITGAGSPVSVAMLLGALSWFDLARLVRQTFAAQRGLPRLEAARALGLDARRLAQSHLLPEVADLVAVWASGAFSQLLLLETGLSFLGIGVPAPQPTWGRVLWETGDVFGEARWLMLGPGLVIAAAVWSASVLADGLADERDTHRFDLPRNVTATNEA